MTTNEILIAFNNAIALFIVIFGLVGIAFCWVELNENRQRSEQKRRLEAENRELETSIRENQKIIEELEERNKQLREILNKL